MLQQAAIFINYPVSQNLTDSLSFIKTLPGNKIEEELTSA